MKRNDQPAPSPWAKLEPVLTNREPRVRFIRPAKGAPYLSFNPSACALMALVAKAGLAVYRKSEGVRPVLALARDPQGVHLTSTGKSGTLALRHSGLRLLAQTYLRIDYRPEKPASEDVGMDWILEPLHSEK